MKPTPSKAGLRNSQGKNRFLMTAVEQMVPALLENNSSIPSDFVALDNIPSKTLYDKSYMNWISLTYSWEF